MKNIAIAISAIVTLFGTPALAADMPLKAPPPPVAPLWTWTGFYVGGNVGYSWGRSSNNLNFFAPTTLGGTDCTLALCATASDTNKLNGAVGGIQAGYNWQKQNFVAGIETDFQLSGQKGHDNSTIPTSIIGSLNLGNAPPQSYNSLVATNSTERLLWFGTLRGRAGVTFDRLLVYGTGGLAYGQVKTVGVAGATGTQDPLGLGGFNCTVSGCPFLPFGSWSDTSTKVGWTAGVGVEGAIGSNWSVKLEYLYMDLGSVNATFATLPGCYGFEIVSGGGGGSSFCHTIAAGAGSIRNSVTDNIVRIGLNYRFGGPVNPGQ